MTKTIDIHGIKMQVNMDKNPYLPQAQEIIGDVEELKNLAHAINKDLPVLIVGETGLGKTALVRHLAYKTNNGFRRLNLNGQTTVDEFVGKTLLNKDGTYWQDGVLIEALRNGYWLLLDEINAALPEILFVLHSLLDDDRFVVLSEHNGEVVRPHPNFRLIATMNPSGKYAGTKDLNKAFLSRFPMVMQMTYPSPEVEAEIIGFHAPSSTKAERLSLAKMAKQLRDGYAKEDIEFICSTRDLINCAKLSQDLGMAEALTLAIRNRANQEDYKAVDSVITLFFGKSGKAVNTVDYEAEYKKIVKERDALLGTITDMRGNEVLLNRQIDEALKRIEEMEEALAGKTVVPTPF